MLLAEIDMSTITAKAKPGSWQVDTAYVSEFAKEINYHGFQEIAVQNAKT